MKASTSALLVGLVAVPAYIAFANTADIAHEWRGVVKSNNQQVAVILAITKVETGGDAGTIKWGEPYRCTSHLEYITQKDKQRSFTLRKGYGPFCESVDGGKLYLTTRSNTQLQYRLTAPKTGATLQETVMTAP